MDPAGDAHVRLARGSLYVSAQIYERYFPGLSCVVLLRRDDDLIVMPVTHAAGGGYLLKLRNAAGDRVVNAVDFFRRHDLDEFEERRLEMAWSAEMAGLVGRNVFASAN